MLKKLFQVYPEFTLPIILERLLQSILDSDTWSAHSLMAWKPWLRSRPQI